MGYADEILGAGAYDASDYFGEYYYRNDDILNGEWIAKDGTEVNLFNASECNDTYFANICKFLKRYGYSQKFINELKRKRYKNLKNEFK